MFPGDGNLDQNLYNFRQRGPSWGAVDTAVTNGAFRVHPTEWNIGESAGELAALCLRKDVEPREALAHVPQSASGPCALRCVRHRGVTEPAG